MRTHVEWRRSLDSRQLDKPIGREQLTAYVSDDDGMTWSGGLRTDAREDVTYPDGVPHQPLLMCS